MAIPTNLNPKTWPSEWMFQAYRAGTLYVDAAFAGAQKVEQQREAAVALDCRGYAVKRAADIIGNAVKVINKAPEFFKAKPYNQERLFIAPAERQLKQLDDEIRKYPQCATGVPQKAMGYLRNACKTEEHFRESVTGRVFGQYELFMVGDTAGLGGAALATALGALATPLGLVCVASAVAAMGANAGLIHADKSRTRDAFIHDSILPLSPENIAAMMQHEAELLASFNAVTP